MAATYSRTYVVSLYHNRVSLRLPRFKVADLERPGRGELGLATGWAGIILARDVAVGRTSIDSVEPAVRPLAGEGQHEALAVG